MANSVLANNMKKILLLRVIRRKVEINLGKTIQRENGLVKEVCLNFFACFWNILKFLWVFIIPKMIGATLILQFERKNP